MENNTFPACTDLYVFARFEACAGFVAGPDGDLVCDNCGWLADEHLPVATAAAA